MAYRHRYHRLGDLKDLDYAIKKFHEAVDLVPLELPERAGYLQDLAVAFSDRYQRLHMLDDLETAIEVAWLGSASQLSFLYADSFVARVCNDNMPAPFRRLTSTSGGTRNSRRRGAV